jgi:hypothetical protein
VEFGKKHLFALAFMAATGTPYVVSMTGKSGQPAGAQPVDAQSALTVEGDTGANGARPSPASVPVTHLGEVFRFDIQPRWLMGRWARVSTVTPELELRGYRVALVTGTTERDLAGALTYYFDPQQQVRRITFVGATGDPGHLAAFLAQRYGLARVIAPDPGVHLYQVHRDGKVQSELAIRPNPVVEADQPHTRYTVELSLTRPSSFRMFSQAGQAPAGRLGP